MAVYIYIGETKYSTVSIEKRFYRKHPCMTRTRCIATRQHVQHRAIISHTMADAKNIRNSTLCNEITLPFRDMRGSRLQNQCAAARIMDRFGLAQPHEGFLFARDMRFCCWCPFISWYTAQQPEHQSGLGWKVWWLRL